MVLLILVLCPIIINKIVINKTVDKIISINDAKKLDNVDAILVLGCKVNGDYPSSMLANRLEKAVDLYNKDLRKIIISGDHGQTEYDEVNVMFDYLVNLGVAEDDIFMDHAGFSTYDSIYRFRDVFLGKKVIIVTQEYHLYRALYIASKLGLDAYGVKADDINYVALMKKNETREFLARNKDFFKVMIKPKPKYLGETIDLHGSGNVTRG